MIRVCVCVKKMVWVLMLLLVVGQQEEATAAATVGGEELKEEDVVTTVSLDSMAKEGRKQLELMTKEAQMPV